MLKKPLQAAVIGGMFGGPMKMADDGRQIHCAGAYEPHNNHNKYLNLETGPHFSQNTLA